MRFTKKLNPPYEKVAGEDYIYTSETRLTPSFAKVEQKLGKLEDVEEELGIDLLTLFKALKNGIWIKIFPKLKNGGSIIHVPCGLAIVEIGAGVGKSFGLEFYINTKKRYLVLDTRRDNDLKEYGKTWALTKEELL